ncbi:MAG: hypothetical protein V1905_04145 [bacterium]
MVNQLLNNETLKGFIEIVEISSEQKVFLINRLPEMDGEERLKLFNVLKDIYLLDIEEKDAVARVKAAFSEG